jgi:hypothetical protein
VKIFKTGRLAGMVTWNNFIDTGSKLN